MKEITELRRARRMNRRVAREQIDSIEMAMRALQLRAQRTTEAIMALRDLANEIRDDLKDSEP